MNLSQRLKDLRKSKNLTATQVAKSLEIAKSTISNYEKGIREPNIQMLSKLSKIYGTTIDALLNFNDSEDINAASNLDTISIPILGIIRAGDPIYAEENILGYTDLSREYIGKGEYFALYVVGDSMNNCRICEGDTVIVRKQQIVENGEIAVVLIDGECATIKKFFRKSNTVTLMPSSSNTAHKPRNIDLEKIDLKILGKVIEVKIKL